MRFLLNLTANIRYAGPDESFLVKLDTPSDLYSDEFSPNFPKNIRVKKDGSIACEISGYNLEIEGISGDSLCGDVLLCHPKRGEAQRLIRRNSDHNTILFTERCDQLCAMCSQPPNSRDYSPLFSFYHDAILLADEGCRIGISGGEPTLYLPVLLEILKEACSIRRDLKFHILSNAQHFTAEYDQDLQDVHGCLDVLWGVPLYSAFAARHDEIVGKLGAFETLMNNLYRLAGTHASIELRTVVTARNAIDLPDLAKFISTHIPFVSYWAIMAMEPIGYAKANKEQLFFDHSVFPEPITSAIDIVNMRGVSPRLYNFPLCTIPETHRAYCTKSISDWKRKYLEVCNSCMRKEDCTGFFEWYNSSWAWEGVSPILR